MAVINELGGEKIDSIEYSDEPEKFISNALSPAKVLEVEIMPKNKAICFVPEDQLSLAIGKNGQNVRLAAKLTGWKIDVRTPEKTAEPVSAEATAGEEEKKEREKEPDKKEEKKEKRPDSAKATAGKGKKKKKKETKK